MISDDEEEMNFLMGAVDSSSSDEEENPAMISQELRPDFYASAASSAAENLEVGVLCRDSETRVECCVQT